MKQNCKREWGYGYCGKCGKENYLYEGWVCNSCSSQPEGECERCDKYVNGLPSMCLGKGLCPHKCHQPAKKIHCINGSHCFEGKETCDCGEKKYISSPDDWRERFEKEIGQHLTTDFGLFGEVQAIEKFIATLISKAQQEAREDEQVRILNEVPNLTAEVIRQRAFAQVLNQLPKERKVYVDPQDKSKSIIFEIEGYNQALADIKTSLQKQGIDIGE